MTAAPPVAADPAAVEAAILDALTDAEPGAWVGYWDVCRAVRLSLAWERPKDREEVAARHKVVIDTLAALIHAFRVEVWDKGGGDGNDPGFTYRLLAAEIGEPAALPEPVISGGEMDAEDDDLAGLTDPFEGGPETEDEARLRAEFEAEEAARREREEAEARAYARGRANLEGRAGEERLEKIMGRIEQIIRRPIPREARGAIQEGARRARANVLANLPDEERNRLRAAAFAELKRGGKGRGDLAVDLLAARLYEREQNGNEEGQDDGI